MKQRILDRFQVLRTTITFSYGQIYLYRISIKISWLRDLSVPFRPIKEQKPTGGVS